VDSVYKLYPPVHLLTNLFTSQLVQLVHLPSSPAFHLSTKGGLAGQAGTSWDKLGQAGTSWDKLGQAGTSWDKLGQAGTSWDKVERWRAGNTKGGYR
jgi:hypothetical protein